MDRELLDWRRTGRGLARVLLGAATVSVLGAGVTWGLTGEVVRAGALWAGVGALLVVVGAVFVVGVSAVRGMLRAGDRGDRLADGDVGLLPPQVGSRPPGRTDGAEAP